MLTYTIISYSYARAKQKRPFFLTRFSQTARFLFALLLLMQLPVVSIAQCISSSTLTAALTSSNDDAIQSGANVSTETSSLSFANQYIGLRFPSVYIPKSATITSAYIQFTGSSPATGANVSNVGIRGHSVANSSSFTAATGSNELSTRYLTAPTSASLNWSEDTPWASGVQGASTPDLAAIVQEIVNRSDWKPNNAITILFDATSATGGPSARAYDDPLHKSPRLIVTFKAATSLSIIPTVSGCFNTTAGSRATVSTEIRWTDAPANDSLIVMLGSQRLSIMPGVDTIGFYDAGDMPYMTLVRFEFASPQVLTFEIPADGSAGTVTTFFKSNTACTASATYTAPAACPAFVCTPGTDLSGTAFNDFNADGIKNAGEITGIPGVTVKAYDCAGGVYTATTDANGQYKLTIPVANYPVRVEFTNLPAGYLAQGTPNGADGRTTVQFLTAPDCGVDFGMSDPTNYCQNNPKIFVPCYVSGDPLIAGAANASELPAFVSVNYADYSIATSSNTYSNSNLSNPLAIAKAKQVGSLWGTVYNRQTKTIFTSAVLRRQSGLGPLGLGGIYTINPATNTVTNFLDVTSIGINVGSNSVSSNSVRGLSSNPATNSHDATVFSQVGKFGIGGIALSSTNNQLYFVNLFDKKVYGLDITAYNTGGTAPTTFTSFPIPSGCSAGSNSRPWAIKYHSGKVYVGVVCDGAESDNRSDLRAFIYALDPTSGSWTTAFDFPLTYPKGPSILFDNPSNGTTSSNWRTWTDTFSEVVNTDGYYLTRSQPILSSIEFDVDNSIVMAFANRTSLQGGAETFSTNTNDANVYYTISGGDILRAANKNGIYTLENNAKAGGATGSFPNNNQGPGLGEFYDDNFFHYSILGYAENALGGLALRPGSGNVVTSAMSPLNEFQDGTAGYGFRQLSNTTGAVQSSYIVYQDNNSQKSVSLGDFDLGCSTPSFIEIGNRVWIDTDSDGLQDPCESALAGVNVSLYKSGTLIASTTTNGNGEYYFSSKSKLTSGTWSGTGADTTLLANTAYQIAFGNGQFTNNGLTIGNFRYQPATAFSTTPTASTLNDSNVQLASIGGNTLPVANVTTGDLGSVNHTIDAGFVCLPPSVATISATPAICAGPSASPNSARIDLSGLQNAEKAYLYTTGPAPAYTAVGGQPISTSAVSFTGLADPATVAGQSYSIIIYNTPTCSTIVTVNLPQAVCGPCAMTLTANPQACQGATNSYALTGTISLTSAVPGTITVTDGSTTVTLSVTLGQTSVPYSLTGLLAGTGSHTVTASLPNCSTVNSTYSAPASCSVAPVCSISAVATAGICASATNTYDARVVVNLTNATSGTLSVSIPGAAPVSQTMTAGTTSLTVVVPGLTSDGAIHTATISLPGCGSTTANYSAPASCSVAPVCSLTATATAGICASATNTYSANVVINLTNASSGTLSVSIPGAPSVSQLVTSGTTSLTVIVPGLTSDGTSHTATVSLPGCGSTTANYTSPISCSVASICSINAVPTQSLCQAATNTFSNTVVVTVNNPVAGSITIRDGSQTATFSTTVNMPNTFTAVFPGIVSNGASRTVVTTLPGCSTLLTTYTAPTSCSVAPVCSLTAAATAGICEPATNTYSANVVVNLTNAISGTLSVSIPGAAPVSQTLTAGTTSLTIVVPGLTSDGAIHTATISLPSCGSTTANYSAPASCSVAPVCSLTAAATAGICTPATNTYSANVVVNLTNAISGTLSVSIPGASAVSQTLTAGTTSLTVVVPSLTSDGAIHTATISLPGCGSTTANYSAPASCSVAPCSLTAAATGGICASATNTYDARVVVNLTNASSGTLSVSIPGASPISQTLAAGTASLTVIVPSLTSDGAIHTATISLPGCGSTIATYTAPASCSVAPPVCAVSATATAGMCASATNTFTTTVKINVTNPVAGTLTVTDGALGQTIVATASSGVTAYTVVFPGITSDGASHTVTISLPGCSTTSTTYTAPGSCTQPVGTQLSISKSVSKAKAKLGETLTYTLILTNAGSTTATHVVVKDSTSTGLKYVANSATAPVGTTFVQGSPISTWTVGAIAPAQSLTLSFQSSIDSTGILYNQASIPGDTATACTSVPVQVCTGDTYLFRLTAPTGRLSYKWYRNGVQIVDQTTNILNVTTPGSYSLAADSLAGQCPSFSCCPFIIEEDTLPTFQAMAIPVSCASNTPQANGQIVLTNFRTGYTYQYSAGLDFNESSPLSGAAQVIPANGVIVSTLANPASSQPYTVRVYNSSGCYTDVTVTLNPITCSCSLTAVATAGICASATNTYSANVVVNLTNASSGTLSVSVPGATPVSQTIAAGTTSLTVVVPDLASDGTSHTATITLPGCGSTTANYTAPVSCSVAPVCSLTAAATASICTPATNMYDARVVVNLTNATSGTLSVSVPGASPVSQTMTAGTTSLTVVVPGLTSDAAIHTATISLPGCGSTIATYSAPASCSVAPVCSLTAAATAGICASATNTYSANVVVNLTNATSGTLSVSIAGASPVSQTVAAGTTSLTVVVPGLNSDGAIHTVLLSLPGCGTASATYMAPNSCSVTPACSLIAAATADICNPATNTYSANVVVNLTNANSGTLSVSIPGAAPISQSIASGTTSLTVVVAGLNSDGAIHTATISLPGCGSTIVTYTAPNSCTTAPVCSLTAAATAGICASATNTYDANVVISLTNASSGTLSVSIPGTAPVTQTIAAGTTSLTVIVPGLISDGVSHTATISLPDCSTAIATYTAPVSCSVAPVCSLTATATAGICASATNTYSANVVVALTNASSGTLSVSIPGTAPVSQTIAAGTTSLTIVVPGLVSDGASHTATVSLPGCGTTTATYTAPVSCSVAPVCSLTATATAGICASATNTYDANVVISLTNASSGTL
ncbi:SdrD B-like domain-containing protein, partial [Spirosoma harenae]